MTAPESEGARPPSGGHPPERSQAPLWQRLRALDPDDVTARSLARTDQDGRYQLPVLGSQVWVDPRTEAVTSAWPEVIRPDFFLEVSAVGYLLSAREVSLAGELVSPAQVPEGEMFFRGPHELPGDALGALFGADSGRFREVLTKLGGRPAPLADVGMEVSIYPRLPFWLGFWRADDEFPARVTFLLDRSASAHLPLDALWAAIMVPVGAVRRLAGKAT